MSLALPFPPPKEAAMTQPLTSDSAPCVTTPKKPKRASLVIAAGVASTVLILFLVYILDASNANINPMGWYADYVIPVGAILIGLIASSGYALVAWLTGLKIRRGLLVAIVLLQIGGYFSAKYTEFAVQGPLVHQDTGERVGFFEYFHATTVNMAWKDDHDKMGQPLGGLGYAVRFGEIVGFILGTLIAPFALSKRPYCDPCEQYMKSSSLVLLPASNTKAGHLFGKKAIAMTAQQVMENGMTDVVELVSLATAGDVPGFTAKLAALAPARGQAKKLSRRIDVRLVHCPHCSAGRLDVMLVETHGRSTTSKSLGQTELSAEFLRAYRTPAAA